MRLRTALVAVAMVFLLSGASFAADRTSFGLGLGAMYNGVGANVSFLKAEDLKFVALGCTGFGHSSIDGTIWTCGISGGWLKSNILTKKNSKHGLGLTVGLGYDSENSDVEPVLSIPYVFFFKGIVSRGWNLGLAPFVRWDTEGTDLGAFIQVGYQF